VSLTCRSIVAHIFIKETLSYYLLNKATLIGKFYMKKLLPILLLLGMSSAAQASMQVRHQSSLQLTANAQQATYTRMGTNYSVSGTNVNTTHTAAASGSSSVTGGVGHLAYGTSGQATIGSISATQSQGCSTNSSGTTSCTGGTFSFAQSFTQGDAYGENADHTKYGNVSITNGATIGSGSPGTVTNAHAITIDQGGSSNGSIGAGSALTGQFVSEISVF